jgi:hypothetical protein
VRVRRIDRKRQIGAVTWLRALGVWGCGARAKQLPPEVFELCDSNIALLLARLWEGDGGVSMKGHASYDTASRSLASQVQYLLLRLGIIARLYRRVRSYKGRELEHQVVTVTGEAPLHQFWHHVGRRFLDPKRRRQSMGSLELLRLSRSDVYWDRIVEIEAVGSQETYDLQIEGDHNFLANHFVVHNSHAASFALLVYTSAWLKAYEPAAFCAALINSQPMGFYAPAQLVRDARAHGVEVRPIDVASSGWDCTLEPQAVNRPALRLGLRLVKHLTSEGADRLLAARAVRAFGSIADLAERGKLERRDLEALAAADALAGLVGHRHRAVWQVSGVERALPLLPAATVLEEGVPLLRAPREGQNIVADYGSTGLTLRRHPLSLLRDKLQRRGVLPTRDLWDQPNGAKVRTAGLVITRQRPGSAGGVTFVTMEDETGYVNLIVWNNVAVAQRAALLESRLLEVTGKLQREGDVQHVIAQRLTNLSVMLGDLAVVSRNFH